VTFYHSDGFWYADTPDTLPQTTFPAKVRILSTHEEMTLRENGTWERTGLWSGKITSGIKNTRDSVKMNAGGSSDGGGNGEPPTLPPGILQRAVLNPADAVISTVRDVREIERRFSDLHFGVHQYMHGKYRLHLDRDMAFPTDISQIKDGFNGIQTHISAQGASGWISDVMTVTAFTSVPVVVDGMATHLVTITGTVRGTILTMHIGIGYQPSVDDMHTGQLINNAGHSSFTHGVVLEHEFTWFSSSWTNINVDRSVPIVNTLFFGEHFDIAHPGITADSMLVYDVSVNLKITTDEISINWGIDLDSFLIVWRATSSGFRVGSPEWFESHMLQSEETQRHIKDRTYSQTRFDNNTLSFSPHEFTQLQDNESWWGFEEDPEFTYEVKVNHLSVINTLP